MTTREVEIAEARGFFMGEGCIFASMHRRGGLYVGARIRLRADDRAVLDWFKQLFGGSVTTYNRERQQPPANPQATWTLCGRDALLRFCDQMMAGSSIPAKKAREFAVFRQAVLLLKKPGGKRTHGDRAEAAKLYTRLRALKRYDAGGAEEPESRQLLLV